ncbi:MAG: hypothetical protein HY608_08755 [Planctomycetes bacterium]|nr:hypothetical protein [Planctomycetota bacterium]
MRAALGTFLVAFPVSLGALFALEGGGREAPTRAPVPPAGSERIVRVNGVPSAVRDERFKGDVADILDLAASESSGEILRRAPDALAIRAPDGSTRIVLAIPEASGPAGARRVRLRTIVSPGGAAEDADPAATWTRAGLPEPPCCGWDLRVEEEPPGRPHGALQALGASDLAPDEILGAYGRALREDGWSVESSGGLLTARREGRRLRMTADAEGNGSAVAVWCLATGRERGEE